MKRQTLFNPILILSLMLVLVASLFAMPVARAASNQTYPAGLVSYWKLDEGSGVTAHDSVGVNTGSITNSNWLSSCTVGPCIQSLSRGATYVNVPDSPSLNITGDQLTVEAWAYPFASSYQEGQGNCGFIGMKATDAVLQYGLCVGGNWAGKFEFHTTTVNGHAVAQSPNSFPAGTWYHIVGVYTGSEAKLYVNGVLVSAAPQSGAIVSSSASFWMGRYCGANGYDGCYSGKTDEVALYNRALTLAEIQQHYQNGLNGLGYEETSSTTSLVATTAASNIYPGDPLSVDLNIQNASNLYAAQADCTAGAAVIRPQSATFGNFFDPVNRLLGANNADAAAGTWSGAISQRSPALPLSGNGLFATIHYLTQAPGSASIACDVVLSDPDGFTQPVTFTGASVTVLPFAIVNGVVKYQGRTVHSSITVTGPIPPVVNPDGAGNFTLSAKSGAFAVTASAPGYLSNSTSVTATSGATTTLPATTLRGGDANNDHVINIGDATLVAANFGKTVPPGDARADINADGKVNIQDLAILGSNYGLAGTQPW